MEKPCKRKREDPLPTDPRSSYAVAYRVGTTANCAGAALMPLFLPGEPAPVSWTPQIVRKCGRSVSWPNGSGGRSRGSSRRRRCGSSGKAASPCRMREREHLAALRPEGRGIMRTTMRFADEIRGAEDLALPAEGEHQKKEMDLAPQLVDALADDWDPAEYHDTYRETLRDADRTEGRSEEIEAPPVPGPANPGVLVLSRGPPTSSQ